MLEQAAILLMLAPMLGFIHIGAVVVFAIISSLFLLQGIGRTGSRSTTTRPAAGAGSNIYPGFKRTRILTTNALAASFTNISQLLSPPPGYPWLAALNVQNNDLDATTTDNGGIESFRVVDSSQTNVLWGPVNYGIGTAKLQTDVSAADADQPGLRYALVNMELGNFIVEARAAVVDTDVVLNIIWSTDPINGRGEISPECVDIIKHAFVVTANIGTVFEDFFTNGDIKAPGEYNILGGVLTQNDEIADTLGMESWQMVGSDQVQILHGPTGEGVGSGNLQGDISAVLKSTFYDPPAIVNHKFDITPDGGYEQFNIQGISTVETDGNCLVIFSKRNISHLDLMYPWGA